MKFKGNLDHKHVLLINDEVIVDEVVLPNACVIADDSMYFLDIDTKISPKLVTIIIGEEENYDRELYLIGCFRNRGIRIRLGQTYGETLRSFCDKFGPDGLGELNRKAWQFPLEQQIADWKLGYGFLDAEIAAGNAEKVIHRLLYYHALFAGDDAIKLEEFLKDKFDLDPEKVKEASKDIQTRLKEAGGDGKKGREQYYDLFETFLPELCSDIITERLVFKSEDGRWLPAYNQLQWLEAEATDVKLFPSMIKRWLADYERERAIKRLLLDLPKWDGIDRIKLITECVHLNPETGLTRVHFYECLCQFGAKVFEKVTVISIQNECIIIIGPQGAGKDELLRAFFGSFGPYYAEATIGRNQNDDYQLANRSLVINLSEFDQTAKAEVAYLKDYITKSRVTMRVPYGREPEELLLRHSLVASSNESNILRDSTGNRRFFIFEIDKIDWNYPTDQGDQILAQFKALKGYRISPETKKAMDEYIASKTPMSLDAQVISAFDNVMTSRLSDLDGSYAANNGAHAVIKEVAAVCRVSYQKVTSILTNNGRSKKGAGNKREVFLPTDFDAEVKGS